MVAPVSDQHQTRIPTVVLVVVTDVSRWSLNPLPCGRKVSQAALISAENRG